jgi:hypothetical protein
MLLYTAFRHAYYAASARCFSHTLAAFAAGEQRMLKDFTPPADSWLPPAPALS